MNLQNRKDRYHGPYLAPLPNCTGTYIYWLESDSVAILQFGDPRLGTNYRYQAREIQVIYIQGHGLYKLTTCLFAVRKKKSPEPIITASSLFPSP